MQAGAQFTLDVEVAAFGVYASCAFDAMVEGKLNCSVECNPLQGPAAFDAIEKILAGETIPKKFMVKDEVFDRSNAKDHIDSRKY